MGCDIHPLYEAKRHLWAPEAGKPAPPTYWRCLGEPLDWLDRDYELFEVLAGVRAEYGLKVISDGRGVPKDASEAGRAMLTAGDEWGHNAGWATLAELRAYDMTQDFYDGHLVTSRDEAGKITGTCAWTTGPHLGAVGHRRLFGTWGLTTWDRLVRELDALKLGDDDATARLLFYFDS